MKSTPLTYPSPERITLSSQNSNPYEDAQWSIYFRVEGRYRRGEIQYPFIVYLNLDEGMAPAGVFVDGDDFGVGETAGDRDEVAAAEENQLIEAARTFLRPHYAEYFGKAIEWIRDIESYRMFSDVEGGYDEE